MLSSRFFFFLTTGSDKEALAWYQQAEIQHSRWAMLGVAGMAAPELFHNPLVAGDMPNWAEAPLWDGYVADANTLFVVQMFMMNFAEVLRWQDMKNPGSVSVDPLDSKRRLTGTAKGAREPPPSLSILNARLTQLTRRWVELNWDPPLVSALQMITDEHSVSREKTKPFCVMLVLSTFRRYPRAPRLATPASTPWAWASPRRSSGSSRPRSSLTGASRWWR